MFLGFWLLLPARSAFAGPCAVGLCPGAGHATVRPPVDFRTRQQPVGKNHPIRKYWPLLYLFFICSGPAPADLPIRVGDFFLCRPYLRACRPLLAGVVLPSFLAFVLGMVLTNAWCRYACPTGGLLEALNPCLLLKSIKPRRCQSVWRVSGRSVIWSTFAANRSAQAAAIAWIMPPGCHQARPPETIRSCPFPAISPEAPLLQCRCSPSLRSLASACGRRV